MKHCIFFQDLQKLFLFLHRIKELLQYQLLQKWIKSFSILMIVNFISFRKAKRGFKKICFSVMISFLNNADTQFKSYSMNSEVQKSEIAQVKHKKFLEDFSLLAELTAEDKDNFEKAKVDSIEEEYEAKLLRNKAGQRYSLNCPIEDFQHYGPGIYLLFKFLKVCIVLFAVASIFATANLILLSRGSVYASSIKSTKFEVKVGVLTFGNIDKQHEQVVPVLSFVGFLLFTCGIVYWKEREIYEVIECSKVRLLSSQYTVILTEIPRDYSEAELKDFLKEFGEVKEIFSVKEFHNDLSHYQEMDKVLKSYKKKKGLIKLYPQTQNSLKLVKHFLDFYRLYSNMIKLHRAKYQPIFAFVTFKKVSSREMLLNTMQESKSLFFCTPNDQQQNLLYKGQRLKFKECKMEPDAINWQNISLSMKSKALRILLQIGLLTVVLILSIIIIYFVTFAKINLVHSKYSFYTKQQMLSLNDQVALKYFCLSLSFKQFYSESMCQKYGFYFKKVLILQICLPLSIQFLKFIFSSLMKYLVQFRKHASYIKKIESQIVITFIFYYMVLGIEQFIMSIIIKVGSKEISLELIMKYIIPFYENIINPASYFQTPDDFNSNWYIFNTSKIVLIALISFNYSSFLKIAIISIKRCIGKYHAKKQDLNIQKIKYLKAEAIEIEVIYAIALNIIGFTLLFGPAIPLVWILGLFSLIILYWSNKFIFVRFCQAPFVFSHSINHLVIRIVLLTISLCSLTAPLLYGGVEGFSIGQRYLHHMYFPILALLILIYMFFRSFIKSTINNLRNIFTNTKHVKNQKLKSILCSSDEQNINLPSFSMHQNPIYQPLLKILYLMNDNQRKRNTFILNQNLKEFIEKLMKNTIQFNQFRELVELVKKDKIKYMNYKFNPFIDSDKHLKFLFKLDQQCKEMVKNSTMQTFNFNKIGDSDPIKINIQQCLPAHHNNHQEVNNRTSFDGQYNENKESQRQLQIFDKRNLP